MTVVAELGVVVVLEPEAVWLAHEHEPWRIPPRDVDAGIDE